MKRAIVLLLVFQIITMICPVTVFAVQESNEERPAVLIEAPCEDVSAWSLGIPQGIVPSTSEEIKMFDSCVDVDAQSEGQRALQSTWYYLDGTYYVYNQTTSYNCVPACIQAVLRYVNGSTPTQATIANAVGTTTLGTYMYKVHTYLNQQQTVFDYDIAYITSVTELKNAVYNDIVTYGVPSIIGLSFSTSDGWLYDTPGHAMSAYGIKSDKSSISLADPWIGYSGSGLSSYSSSYSKTTSTVYNACVGLEGGIIY